MSPGGIESALTRDVPRPMVLEGRDIASLAKYIKSDKCHNIVFMLGAGVSTAAGIPDFRSPKTGLYANLAHLGLPNPEAVFDLEYFRYNPKPFYALAHDLQPGKFRPTLTHSFVRLVHAKGLLSTCFTQNIDTLERRAGIPERKLVEAHGSFASHHCIDCHESYEHDQMMSFIEKKKIARCYKCRGLVKPDIVFFGEQLPPRFFRSYDDVRNADLLIIAGTSLTVYPFASLANLTSNTCPRVLINLEAVGSLGRKSEDVLLLGQCDAMVEQLAKELGWHDELLELWNATQLPKTVETKKTEPAKDEIEDLADELATHVNLKEDQFAQIAEAIWKKWTSNALEPDTNPTDPLKPSIHSKDDPKSKVGENSTSEVPESSADTVGPSESSSQQVDKGESRTHSSAPEDTSVKTGNQ
ncbi:hypothetical protein APHAL10511_002779 [Amanita phalloides]|nr:hypothetical protein APHAL10511_002779 [Amanita phalloides]